MKLQVSTQTIFNCSLERAFKTPMFCDISLIHTGFGIIPAITHSTEDSEWGTVGSAKKLFAAQNLFHKAGFIFVDKVITRKENAYWKIEVSEFQTWILGFYKFEGEWKTTEVADSQVQIDYSYTLFARNYFLYPFNFLFAKYVWKAYMKRVLENVRRLAYS